MLTSTENPPIKEHPKNINLWNFELVDPKNYKNAEGKFVYDTLPEFQSEVSRRINYEGAEQNPRVEKMGHWAEIVVACTLAEATAPGQNTQVEGANQPRLVVLLSDEASDAEKIDIAVADENRTEFIAIDLKAPPHGKPKIEPDTESGIIQVRIPAEIIRKAALSAIDAKITIVNTVNEAIVLAKQVGLVRQAAEPETH